MSLSLLLFLLKWLQWKFLIIDNSIDVYIGFIAVFFTLLGIWVARQLTKTKVETVVIEKPVYINPEEGMINEGELRNLNLSEREWEVLKLMAAGKSNAEIADMLFISISTVKTHASNLYTKMEVRSRTQAISKGKRLRIIT